MCALFWYIRGASESWECAVCALGVLLRLLDCLLVVVRWLGAYCWVRRFYVMDAVEVGLWVCSVWVVSGDVECFWEDVEDEKLRGFHRV